MTISDEEDDTDPIPNILLGIDNDKKETVELLQINNFSENSEKLQAHILVSIQTTLSIRLLPHQGLSFQLWPAALTFVSLLDNIHNINPLHFLLSMRPLHILELGSGTGLVGIAAASILGAHVTLTDLPCVLSNLQFNADANQSNLIYKEGTVNVCPLSWGVNEDMETIGRDFDVIIASDVVYHEHLFDPLLKTLQYFIRGDVIFLMAHLKRWKKKDSLFFKKAKKLFNVELIHSDPPLPGSRIGASVYQFSEKGKKQNATTSLPRITTAS